MRVGWLCDDPGYIGGAELTQAEFREAAPEGVEIVDCPPGEIVQQLDRYVAHNVCRYSLRDLYALGAAPVTWFHHDLSPHVDPDVRGWLDTKRHIFCSTLQRDRYGIDGACIPPALDLSHFRPSRQIRRNGKREGTCSVAQWRSPNKGPNLLSEWARANGPVDVYGVGDFWPVGPNINPKGPLAPSAVAQTLWKYERYVFLPTGLEPFCRSVVEAWAAGCEVITNGLVGAQEWLSKPEKLGTAAEDFWEAVLS